MQIPSQLNELLERDHGLAGGVKATLAHFEPWLRRNSMPFFPEYTDHGIEHIEGVLRTAFSLIRDEARELLTPADATVLILSVLLHDVAMHLSKDGFLALVDPHQPRQLIAGFDDKPWSHLWQDFLGEASRFDARKLIELFGDPEPARRPPLDALQMTERDCLLIGEFVRRHHHRLGHEIARFGVPGPDTAGIQLTEIIPDHADLAGLVARSHGIPVRASFDYLRGTYYNLRQCRDSHVVFLMTILRVADYLQIEAERAPSEYLKVRRLRSPLSQREWNVHCAIKDIQHCHDDPEALFIVAMPDDVKTYLRVTDLLNGLQEEIDSCWAVLGEVYGRYEELIPLGLTLRRIHSNLDDTAEFAKRVPYIPCKAGFEAANPDLLKLLIKPLYGNDPSIGIRELIQNAVDAVRELRAYQQQQELGDIDLTPQNGDVVVSLDKETDDHWWITVSDRGIGMTPEIIRNYFLKAGASYRRSDAWRKQFEDEMGTSRVLRSGRFGVGALAAFLIGPELHVSTRHVEAAMDEGIKFVSTVDTESIEFLHCRRPVGTTIKVRLNREAVNELINKHPSFSWNKWYQLPDPKVVCIVQGQEQQCTPELLMPGSPILPPGWHRIQFDGYSDIHWKYTKAPRILACNGITIAPGHTYKLETVLTAEWASYLWANHHFPPLGKPCISVFDHNGLFPLNLQRTALAEKLPFYQELFDDILRDLIASLLIQAPSNQPVDKIDSQSCCEHLYPGFVRSVFNDFDDNLSPLWSYTSKGVLFIDPWYIHTSGVRKLLLCLSNCAKQQLPVVITQTISHDAIIVFRMREMNTATIIKDFIRYSMTYQIPAHKYNLGDGRGQRVLSAHLLLHRSIAETVNQYKKFPKEYRERITVEWSNKDWMIWNIHNAPEPNIELRHLAENMSINPPPDAPEILTVWYLDDTAPVEISPLARIWKEVVGDGDPVIPYDLKERRRKFAKAYDTLAPYIEAHEVLAEKKHKK